MLKILFTHSYFYQFDQKQWRSKQYYPPLGTITAAAFMRKHGYDVKLFDTNLANSPGDIKPLIESYKPDILAIYDDGFNYLTKMCLTAMRDAAFELIKIGKENNCKVVVSSSDSTDHFKDYIGKGADAILLGEAEESLLEVAGFFGNNSTGLDKIKGLAFKNDSDEIISTGRREVMDDLDSIPMAAWDLVDVEMYKNIWMKNHGYFSMNLATTRGCPYSCNWCAKPIYGRKYNSRSPEHVISEVKYLVSEFGVSHFWICDDIFGLQPGWIQKFRDLVKAENLNFKYTMQSRVDVMLRKDSIEALAQSGLDIVWVGAESGSQKVLDAMAKGITIEQIYQARKVLKKYNVKVAFFLQLGYPGETIEDIRLTEKMLFDLMPDDMGISVSYPLPGTIFYEQVKKDLKEKANWTDSDDLALMFENKYPPRFYKLLHRFLHKKFRKKQAAERIKKVLTLRQSPSPVFLKSLVAYFYYIPFIIFYKSAMNSTLKKVG